MTVYFRKVREDFLADTSLSLEAFRIMSYLVAQAPGFTFQLDHLALVFQGKIGRKRIERARAELIMGGYLVPGKRYRVGGQVRQDGALVNWDRACLPRSHRHPQNRRVGDGGDLTNNEITNNERKSEPAQEAGERDPWATEVPAKLAATNSPLPLPTSADAVRSADASPCSASAVASATPLSSRPADASEPADLDKLREEWHKRDERRRELGVIPERKRFAWRED